MDDRGEDSAVESPLLLNPTTFHRGEKVFAYRLGVVHEAQVLRVNHRTNSCYVQYLGLNVAWVDVKHIMKHKKENLQNVEATSEKQHPLESCTEDALPLPLKGPNVASGKKRKSMSEVNEFGTCVVGSPPSEATRVPAEHGVSGEVGVGEQGPSLPSESMGMNEMSGSGKHGLELLVSNANAGGPVVSNLLEADKALEFITHAMPPGTMARLSALPMGELLKASRCTAVENLLLMEEAAKRLESFEAKEIEFKEEVMRCKATMTSQAKDIGFAGEVVVRLKNKLKEVLVERADVIKEGSRAEAARAQAEAETSALRAGRLELLGRVSDAEGAKMRAEDEAAALKAENDALRKKLAEAEAANKHENDELQLAEAEAANKCEDERLVVAAETEKQTPTKTAEDTACSSC